MKLAKRQRVIALVKKLRTTRDKNGKLTKLKEIRKRTNLSMSIIKHILYDMQRDELNKHGMTNLKWRREKYKAKRIKLNLPYKEREGNDR